MRIRRTPLGSAIPYPLLSRSPPSCLRLHFRSTWYSMAAASMKKAYIPSSFKTLGRVADEGDRPFCSKLTGRDF